MACCIILAFIGGTVTNDGYAASCHEADMQLVIIWEKAKDS